MENWHVSVQVTEFCLQRDITIQQIFQNINTADYMYLNLKKFLEQNLLNRTIPVSEADDKNMAYLDV